MFSIDEYAKEHKEQFVIGRRTPEEVIDYIINTLPATIEPIDSLDPIIIESFIKTISNSPRASAMGIRVEKSTCVLIKVSPLKQYSDYIDSICNWIYVLVEKQTGEIDSNCSKLTLDLYVYRGLSKRDLLQKNLEYTIYVNYLKQLNEMNSNR